MGPDFRLLVKKGRKIAMQYELMYGEEIPTVQLVTKIAALMQEYTQSGYGSFLFGGILCHLLNMKALMNHFEINRMSTILQWRAAKVGVLHEN